MTARNTTAATAAARVVPEQIARIRARWVGARRVGPWSRHRDSVALLRHAQDDIGALLAVVDTTDGDPVGALFYELHRLGAVDITVAAVRPLAGTRGRYQVCWSYDGVRDVAEGWSPAVALRKAAKQLRRAHASVSDALEGGEPCL